MKPVAWFGIINAACLPLGLAANEAVCRLDSNSHVAVATALSLLTVGLSAAVITFGLARSFPVE